MSRTVTLILQSFGGKIPKPEPSETTELETELQATAEALLGEKLPFHLGSERLEFNRTLEAIWRLVQLGNQYIDKTTPWAITKNAAKKNRLCTVLYSAAEALRFLCVAVSPFMPRAAKELSRQLGLNIDFSKPILADKLTWGDLAPGSEVVKGNPLFPRIDPGTPSKQGVNASSETTPTISSKEATQQAPSPTLSLSTGTPGSLDPENQISIEDFQKIQLKVGKIIEVEQVPKSNKLLKLQVDLGTEQRQIIAGIGKKYTSEDLVGKTIVVVANLKPAQIMGVESQGMVLAAGENNVLGLVTISENGIDPGTQVK